MDFEWWHWIVLGIALVIAELAVPAFFVIWFGLGALLVGLALLTRLVFAGLQAYAMAGGTPALGISAMYAVVGTVLQVLHGVAIILLGLAIIRR